MSDAGNFLLSFFSYGAVLCLTSMLAVGVFPEKRKISTWNKLGLLFLIWIFITAAGFINEYFFDSNTAYALILAIVMISSAVIVLCKTKFFLAVLFGICAFLVMESIGVTVSILVFWQDRDTVTPITLAQRSIRLFLIYTISFLLFLIIIRIQKKIDEEKQYKIALAVLFFSTLLFIVILIYNATFGVLFGLEYLDSNRYISGISILFILLSDLSVFALTKSIVQRNLKDKQLEVAEELLAVQKEHISQMAAKQEQIKQMSHDFKHHVHTLIGLQESGRQMEMAFLLHELAQRPAGGIRITSTGNNTIDALISIKQEIAEREGILCDWQVTIPPQIPLHELDTCAILGNALDNAIEACRRAEIQHPFIKVNMQCEAEWLRCSITNSIGQKPKIEEGLFKTLKYDTENHGLGLQSIKSCCQSMGGDLEVFYDSELFTVRFMLPLAENS